MLGQNAIAVRGSWQAKSFVTKIIQKLGGYSITAITLGVLDNLLFAPRVAFWQGRGCCCRRIVEGRGDAAMEAPMRRFVVIQ